MMTDIQILIVEDEGIVAEEIKSRLLNRGYGVSGIVSTGEAAIRSVEEQRPDLVLMDIRLKGDMDGVEAAGRIRERRDIPVVYLTAYADDETLDRAKITEPFGYILKPFEESDLHSNIEMALYNHEMEQRLKKSEENYRTLFDNAVLGIYRLSQDETVLMANSAFVRMLGYDSQEELLKMAASGTSLYSPKHPRTGIRERMEKENKLVAVESAWLRKDGSTLYTRENIRSVRDKKGNFLYCEGIVEDVSEKMKAQHQLEKTLRDLRKAVFIIDVETAEVTFCNAAASKIFGEIEVSRSSIDEALIIIAAYSEKKSN